MGSDSNSLSQFDSIPKELQACCRWVVFRLLPDKDNPQRLNKIPFRAKSPHTAAFSGAREDSWASLQDAVTAFFDTANKLSGIGLDIGRPFLGLDLDKVRNTETGVVEPWAEEWIKEADTYTEVSPSGKGFHLWFKGSVPKKYDEIGGVNKDGAEIYGKKRYFTVTGEGNGKKVREIDATESKKWFDRVAAGHKNEAPPPTTVSRKTEDEIYLLLMQGKIVDAGYSDPSGDSEADCRLCRIIAKKFGPNRDLIEQHFNLSALARRDKWQKRPDYRNRTIDKALEGLKPKAAEIDPDAWREGYKSKAQLTTEQPQFLIDKLIPEGALTFITAGSYNCKTWLAMAAMKAISTGEPLWCFNGPQKPIPVRYHVPEMGEALVRQRMDALGIEDSEMFLVRTMEAGIWTLNDPRMLRSAKGCTMVYDTTGYFNPGDDSASYKQSIDFALLVYSLLNEGARAVIGICHPPKYSRLPNGKSGEAVWTLENSILGSAGYGGILRSCLRMANLNPDLNDSNVWVYAQGLKNPGLKPFQLQGPLPLQMKVPPGESPYLADLLKGKGDLTEEIWELKRTGKSVRDIESELKKKYGKNVRGISRGSIQRVIDLGDPDGQDQEELGI